MDEGDVEMSEEKPNPNSRDSGRNLPRVELNGHQTDTTKKGTSIHNETSLMEAILERDNMFAAYRNVKRNKGAPGIDNMTVKALKEFLKTEWPRIREELLEGRYQPQSVLKAREYVTEGREWVVDMDLEKFFDRVNHDILMSRVARKIKDKRVLKLIRKYLQAGIMVGGIETTREEGTPQGGPLSPLLSNILLDELDKELEGREHKFCRYADDCNIYVKSKADRKSVV